MSGAGETGPCFVSSSELSEMVGRLGRDVTRDHPDGVVLVGLLKGSVCLVADLARRIGAPCAVDFLALSPYRSGGRRVRLAKDLDLDVTAEAVVLAVDIVDRGLTAAYVMRLLGERGARSVDLLALLDRRDRRLIPIEPTYVGRVIGDEYVVGYGLDLEERYRNLPELRTVTSGDS